MGDGLAVSGAAGVSAHCFSVNGLVRSPRRDWTAKQAVLPGARPSTVVAVSVPGTGCDPVVDPSRTCTTV